MTLRVTLEIVPFGVEANKRTIHVVDISNMGKNSPSSQTDICNYRISLDGEVIHDRLPHSRAAGAVVLAAKALDVAHRHLAAELSRINQELKLD